MKWLYLYVHKLQLTIYSTVSYVLFTKLFLSTLDLKHRYNQGLLVRSENKTKRSQTLPTHNQIVVIPKRNDVCGIQTRTIYG